MGTVPSGGGGSRSGSREVSIGGRDNRTGEFVPLKETECRPSSTTREVIRSQVTAIPGATTRKSRGIRF